MAPVQPPKSIPEAVALTTGVDPARSWLYEFFTQSPSPIAVTSGREHRWSFLNSAFLKLIGRQNAEELLQRTLRDTLPEVEKQGYFALLDEVYRSGKPFVGRSMKMEIASAEGSAHAVYFDCVYQPIRTSAGEVEGILIQATDVSEQVATRKALEKSEQQFRTLADSMPALAWMANADGWVFWYNRRWYEYTGSNPDHVEGWGWESMVEPGHLARVTESWKASLQSKLPFEMVFPLRGANGEFHTFLTRVIPVRDEAGQVFRWCGTSTDISGQLRTEEALRQSRERLRAALVASHAGTFRWDPHTGEYLEFDDSLKELFGIPINESVRVPEDFLKRVHPEDLPAVRAGVERTRDGEDFEGEYRIVLPDGSIRWIYDRAKMLFENGKPLYLVGACMDTTTRKQADIARLRLAAIVESSDDAIVSKDLNGIVMSWNAGAERIFGYKPEEIIGRPITTIIPPELQHDEVRILAKLRRGERIDHFETVRLRKNGELVDISLTVSPVRDDFGRIIGAAKIARDITEKKRAEQLLRTSEKLASAGRMAATMAHEINNPLESVVNLIYLACSDKGLSQQTRAYLTAADEELARVSHITKQTLGFYRESSAPLPTRMSQLLDTLVLVYGTRLRNKNIQLKIDAGREIEVPVVRGEIRQVLANILQNSIEAVAHGGAIRVRTAKARRWTDEAEGLKVSFADNGSGIPRHDRSRIFEPFFTTKKDIGTGLGLWVSKGILDRHGGNIRIRSKAEPGNGWTVTSIFLPAVSQLLPEDAPSAHSFL